MHKAGTAAFGSVITFLLSTLESARRVVLSTHPKIALLSASVQQHLSSRLDAIE